ncbi:preprotein translocase subunit SecD [Phyllobacterium ifriqiyense]|uniref:Preprotein translocase subunit SecD n=1 Tax=Phyllobacterium ifriqiyense TaxID=314238 RepID=A0ABU0SFM5_9HYPH|nr:preprotein translocase subunit SecD [Phyllobacterium ifriqiyense]
MRTSRWVLWTYIFIILAGIVLAFPNMFTKAQLDAMPNWLPKKQVALGLDLRGGSYLVLEVDAAALKKDRIRSILDDARGRLRTAKIQPQSVRIAGDSVVVTITDPAQRDAATTALRELTTQVAQIGFAAPVSDIDIATNDNQIRLTLTDAGMKDKLDNALTQSLEIVRRRVDQVGVAEPSIQRVGSDRIVVQLPGLQDPSQLRARCSAALPK